MFGNLIVLGQISDHIPGSVDLTHLYHQFSPWWILQFLEAVDIHRQLHFGKIFLQGRCQNCFDAYA